MLNSSERKLLLTLTGLPTAAGLESAVISYVHRWLSRRAYLKCRADRYGNLLIESAGDGVKRSRTPLVFEAHMDHPALVVDAVEDERQVVAALRGGVHASYVIGAKVCTGSGKTRCAGRVVEEVKEAADAKGSKGSRGSMFAMGLKRYRVKLDRAADSKVEVNTILRWDVGLPEVQSKRGWSGERLVTPVCDNLVSVVAGLLTMERLYKRSGQKSGTTQDVRLLLTRCEEVGFIGAMGACRAKTIPKGSRVIVLENSKSDPNDSPLGGGVIVRVGDRVSTFDPEMTRELAMRAEQLVKVTEAKIEKQKKRKGKTSQKQTRSITPFRFMRKLMAGGACNATAFCEYGFRAGCLCLPLGNYHNMNEATGKLDREMIDLEDFESMVRLMVAMGEGSCGIDGEGLDRRGMRRRLDGLFDQRKGLIGG